jgi:tRNA-Thr(GGU) m(6)t(6)A37 methyltransferase TsaA
LNDIQIYTVGVIKSPFTPESGNKQKIVADVILKKKYAPALKGIEDYSHIIILFWMQRISSSNRKILKINPRGRKDMPLVGVFATRSKARPNPIGLAVVELVEKEYNVLKVRGLDAFDGTPVLDIKPYDFYDIKQDIHVPKWWLKMSENKIEKD